MKQIVGNVIKNLGQIGGEVITESVEQVGKIGESIISGKELLGDIKPMSQEELQRKKLEDEKNKKDEINKLMGGRNLEGEIEEIRKEKGKKEEEEEKMLRQIQIEREEERREHEKLAMEMDVTPANKRKKERGSVLNPKKKVPIDQTSQTGEFVSKVG